MVRDMREGECIDLWRSEKKRGGGGEEDVGHGARYSARQSKIQGK